MISSGVRYQAGLARIADLRQAADERRHANLASPHRDTSGSMSARRRERLRQTLAALRPPRTAPA
jgi:hypothetical protein